MERLSPAAGHDSARSYERHRQEEAVLYYLVQSELETFLSRGRDRPLLRFVERELRGCLECGISPTGLSMLQGYQGTAWRDSAEARIRGVSASGPAPPVRRGATGTV